ncbi:MULTISPECIES: ATP-binding protein [unclassified Oceanispirochaeta]|uniref:ATP-binding protein n=1 Tax=unclassified Oceanispirochaeta TaxID=2635722 RepID=UPI000E08E4B2|nr:MULTISPECIES: ATP-binding protein [unclassified Oceanispirochaeta]MBF9014455.1 ATP-binding protein [Oceanispirochaeta sp. M2]NPD70711.1 anti-sigma regulatory factor [Oceanispirochaeta sp. M1]RDG33995.1 anti-sigma regulatory factor [Oceanispirochaeta sp. M1]
MIFEYEVSGDDYSLAGRASSDIKKKLKQLGIPSPVIKKTAISMYEAEINMVIHADGGKIVVTLNPEQIKIVLEDTGPGIPDLDQAMQEGYTTACEAARELGFGAGMGLMNIQRNSDSLHIDTVIGQGTTVTILLYMNG